LSENFSTCLFLSSGSGMMDQFLGLHT
jgi:hypothetical protein